MNGLQNKHVGSRVGCGLEEKWVELLGQRDGFGLLDWLKCGQSQKLKNQFPCARAGENFGSY